MSWKIKLKFMKLTLTFIRWAITNLYTCSSNGLPAFYHEIEDLELEIEDKLEETEKNNKRE